MTKNPIITKKPFLFEFCDLDKTPSWYHLYLRKHSAFCYQIFKHHQLWITPLKNYIKRKKPKTIREHGSGSGETLKLITQDLDLPTTQKINFLMSDLKPQEEMVTAINIKNDQYHYDPNPVDATKVHNSDSGTPQIFINTFHHFSDAMAIDILKNNLQKKNDIIILEYVKNTPLAYLSMIIGATSTLLFLPFMVNKKDIFKMICFTYIIPLFPLMTLWDGIISCMRTKSHRQIKKMLETINCETEFVFKSQRSWLYPIGTTALFISKCNR